MVKMARRLIRLQPYIESFLDEYGVKDQLFFFLDESLFLDLKQIVACLEPLEKAIVLLSKHDSNLLVADAVIKFVFASLSRANTRLSNELLNSIKTEVIPRRNQDLVSLLKVLRHCSFDVLKDQRVLKYSSKSRVIEIANRLYA